MSRETFLARVAAAAGAGRAYRVHPKTVPPNAGYLGAGDDPVARFAEEVAAVGGIPHVAENCAAARACLGQLLDEIAPGTAFCWRHAALDRLGLDELLSARRIERIDHDSLGPLNEEQRRAAMLAAGVGITGVAWAVAETGSIALASGPGAERLASLLPPVAIALVERGQLLPDLFDLFAKYDPAAGGQLPSNLALVTGPSKTGDIELRLTTGVHGPGVWHVLVW